MIVILTKVTLLTAKHAQSIVDGFFDSSEFKESITIRLQATLLDPSLPSYVAGLTPRLMVCSLTYLCLALKCLLTTQRHMQTNPSAYSIPKEVQANLMYSKSFFKEVGRVLSNF
jgi:hypothetical protein